MIARQGRRDADRHVDEDIAELLHLLSQPARLRTVDMLPRRSALGVIASLVGGLVGGISHVWYYLVGGTAWPSACTRWA